MKIFIKTFGCRVNQVESEAMLEEFISEGNIPVEDFKEADVCLLNTCTVTQNADRDAEREIRYIAKHNPKAKIIVTGCYALTHKDELAAKFPFVQAVFKAEVGQKLFGKQFDWTVKEHEGKTRAFVKIQDGCNNFCSYCIVPYARPQKTSKPKPVVLNEVKNLLANGYKEIVLTGINVGNYLCPQTGADLAELTRGIVALEGNFRIRFSSIEINTVSDALVEVLASAGQKACNYFHLPLQSGSDAVLKNMRRRYSTEEYLKRVEEIKKSIPDLSVFCDIIAGYPSETQKDFDITKDFIKQVGFAGLHVFSYSKRPGTVAAKMPQIPHEEIKRRADDLRDLDKKLRASFAKSLIGTKQRFLAEETLEDGTISGLASNFARVHLKNAKPDKEIIPVKIIASAEDVCIAEKL